MGKKSERGNVAEIIVIIVLLLAVIGLIIWRIADSNRTNQTNTAGSQQVSNEQRPVSPSTDANKGYIVLDDWGIRFKPVDSSRVAYYKLADNPSAYHFTTERVQSFGGMCTDIANNKSTGGSLGAISRMTRQANPDDYAGGVLNGGNKIGDYYYYYNHPQALCSEGLQNNTMEQADTDMIQKLIATIELKQ